MWRSVLVRQERSTDRTVLIDGIRVALIWAMSRNRVIGRDNALPWRLASDMQHFKRTTLGKPVIMGRRTFQSLGRPLPARLNIVLTRDRTFAAPHVTVVHDLEAALESAATQCLIDGQDELYVIGGAEVYALTLPLADRLYLTQIHAQIDGDTFFPDFDSTAWREVGRVEVSVGERDSHAASIVTLDRIQPDG